MTVSATDREGLTMHHRRATALAAGALLLAAPLLSSCGFDYATDRVNTIAMGINDRDGQVDVLGAVVIAGQDNAGVFVATLVNNSVEEPSTLVSLEGAGLGEAGSIMPIGEVEPIELIRSARYVMADDGGIDVSGAFKAGDFVTVTLGFENGQTSTLSVPVVTPCREFADLVEQPIVVPDDTAESPLTDSADAESEAARYSCEPLDPDDYGHGGAGEEGGGEE